MKLGKNDPCHCGSGNKYKKCHLEADDAAKMASLNAAAAAARATNPAIDPDETPEEGAARRSVEERTRDAGPVKPKPTGKIQSPPVRRRAV